MQRGVLNIIKFQRLESEKTFELECGMIKKNI